MPSVNATNQRPQAPRPVFLQSIADLTRSVLQDAPPDQVEQALSARLWSEREALPPLSDAARRALATHVAAVFAEYHQVPPAVISAAAAIRNLQAGRALDDDGLPFAIIRWVQTKSGRSRAWAYDAIRQHGNRVPRVIDELAHRRANQHALRALGYSAAAAYSAVQRLERRNPAADARLLPPPRGARRQQVYAAGGLPLRRAYPEQAFEYADGAGTTHTFSADANGVVQPVTEDDARVCDLFFLPIAQGWPGQA